MINPLRILLVDDDQDDKFLFQEALEGIEHPAHFSYKDNGIDALKWLSNVLELPHYIFLDLNMPKMNGMEVLAEIKKTPRIQNIPVIIYSTSNNETHREESKRKGASLYISKPYKLNDLKNAIRSVFETLTPGQH